LIATEAAIVARESTAEPIASPLFLFQHRPYRFSSIRATNLVRCRNLSAATPLIASTKAVVPRVWSRVRFQKHRLLHEDAAAAAQLTLE
jgi:hypothetical protein